MSKEIKYVLRGGGSWHYSARSCRSAYRDMIRPGDRFRDLGFRPAFRLKRVKR